MADPRAFIGFDFDHDSDSRALFAGQGKNDSPTPFVVADWSSKVELPQAEWEKRIAEKIAACHFMVVLVGRYMSSATGVAKEIAFAKDLNVPYFGVYVDSATTDSTLPTGLPRNRTIAWTWSGIGSAIDQVMTEGKNKAK